jgi:hypothetical protein
MMGGAIIFAEVILFASLSQALGLVAPVFFDFWVREDEAEHGERGGRGEDDNQTQCALSGDCGLGAKG